MDAYQSTAIKDQKNIKGDLDHAEPSSASGKTIGSYVDAIYYREGICSTIYKARDVNGRLVALKLTRPSIMTPPHDSQREGRILKQCASSHVVALTDTFRQSGGYYILAFPFMPHDLDALLGQGALSLDQVKSHLRDVFSALESLHSTGVIHRDIKPSNILLASPSGPAYLADFGIAWSPNDKASEPADHKITDVGTTSYRPPELLFGNAAYGCPLDLWAAGCVVAEALRLGSRTFFDAGALGSELALIQSIFQALGTPNLEIWPVSSSRECLFHHLAEDSIQEAASFPDWGKMEFYKFPPKPWAELLPSVPTDAVDLVKKLLRYQSSERLAAAEVGIHQP